ILLVLPLACSPYVLGVMISTAMFVSLGLGLNIVVGKCKLLDLGYAGFIGIDAYTTAILMISFGYSFWIAALTSFISAFVAGILLGLPTIHLAGDYFAIVTFGFSELVVLMIRNWPAATGGAIGLGGIPDPVLLGITLSRYPPTPYWYLALSVVALTLSITSALSKTLLDSQMVAIGDDIELAGTFGIDSTAIKLAAFSTSAGIAGLVGSFWAVYFKFLSYSEFSLTLSVQVLAIVVLAASRSNVSVILAALVLAPLGEFSRLLLRQAALPESSRVVFYGAALMFVVFIRAKLTHRKD
ncbi:MAG TPA: branched-chain amino acid ABC transporter permease, partial [Planctomycetaceae bacterium]|nr:branched-chain amino acid ABC transporter permease [Planctomycetaceae bacterium]